MTTLWMVRHGPTHARTMVGWTDLPADLSDGAALERLADYLPADAPVISSDLRRARATADAIAGDRPRRPDDADLREIHFGRWEDRGFDDVSDADPDLLRAFWERPGPVAAPGGESWNGLHERVSAAIDRLRRPGLSDLIVVCHFGAILTQIQRARGLTAKEVFAHRIENLSVTRIDTAAAPWRADPISHLP